MAEFEEFMEGRAGADSAIIEVASALKMISRKYTNSTMYNVFEALGSKRGQDLLKNLARRPLMSVHDFKDLV